LKDCFWDFTLPESPNQPKHQNPRNHNITVLWESRLVYP